MTASRILRSQKVIIRENMSLFFQKYSRFLDTPRRININNIVNAEGSTNNELNFSKYASGSIQEHSTCTSYAWIPKSWFYYEIILSVLRMPL